MKEYDNRLVNIENKINNIPTPENERKTLLLLGDSLCEMKDNDNQKTFSQYIEELSDYNILNCGVGGAQLTSRRTVIPEEYTTNSEAYTALDIYNVVKAIYEGDFSKQISAAEYLKVNAKDDNTS